MIDLQRRGHSGDPDDIAANYIETLPYSIDDDRTIQSVPKKTSSELAGVWRNALSLLGGPFKDKDLLRLIAAIEREWKRRRLEYAPDDYFKWPTTDAPGGGSGLSTEGWLTDGLLAFLGYHVGLTDGLEPTLRRSLLSRVFWAELPPVHSTAYMAQWAAPQSGFRLRKMAASIAAFARNAKRRHNPSPDQAIADWENDLKFLFDEFYVNHFRFHFVWPTTIL
ncbi:MAG: hypothetical protein ABI457_07700 [Hyphomicrobium sp.]